MTAILMFLSKVPFIGSIVQFAIDKKRLFIEYLMIAIVLALGAFVFTMWLEKKATDKQITSMAESLVQLQNENLLQDNKISVQDKTIDDLKTLRKIDNEVLTILNDKYLELFKSSGDFKNKLNSLEKTNEPVKSYLNAPIPDELKCMLNKTCKGNNDNGN